MDDDLESFLAEQKAKVAEERAILAQDPPYLEIRQTKGFNAYNSTIKENIPPSKWSSVQRPPSNPEESAGLSLQLGEDYERKKHRLQQELRLDYRRYMAQGKQVNVAAGEAGLSQHGLSLPLTVSRRAQALSKGPSYSLENQPSPRPPTIREQPPSRKDATTLIEAGQSGPAVPRGRRLHEGRGYRPGGELDQWERPRGTRAELGWGRDCSDYEEEEELPALDRRAPRGSQEPGHTDRRGRRYRADRDVPRLRERGLNDFEDFPEMFRYVQRLRNENRLLRERRGAEPPPACDDDRRDESLGTLSTTPKPRLQEAGPGRPNEKSRSTVRKDEAEFATGLMIGAADADAVAQRRKELYRQELQEQMAEQQRNRKREKELEHKVAVTGALDPEKPPDRIRYFGPMGRNSSQMGRGLDAPSRVDLGGAAHDERLPPERPRVAFQSPLLDYGAALGVLEGSTTSGVTPVHEDYHRGPSSNLGDLSAARLSGVPQPPPSTLSDMYRTPYDDAYFYYGARDPLDPGLAHYGPAAAAPPTALNLLSGAQSLAPPGRLGPHPPFSSQRDAGPLRPRAGVFPPGKDETQAKESLRSYQEALKQQIREQQERRRREKEERERDEARLEAEMRTYDPWGRGGGGAPLKDGQGNLISDLNQMHKTNEEAYLNPSSRDKRELGSSDRKEPSPKTGERPPSSVRVSGFTYGQSPFARGSVFTDVPTPQQLQQQDKYKDCLRQQIEEKRCREAEERERLRQEEEKEERRLEEQRARILREYEEEQEKRRRKELEQKAKNEELARLAEERRKEAERKKKEQEEKEREARRREYEQERQARLQEVVREPSPPIPTLQKRWGSRYTPRPPSVDSRRSTVTLSERCLSGSQSPPVPAQRNQLRAAAEQQGVISELSALRRQLRSEQRRLGEQLQMQAEWEGLDTPLGERERPHVDVFDMARLRIQAPVRRPSSKTSEPISVQSSCDFKPLRYRDRDSAEDAGQSLYPEPPGEGSMQQRRAANLRRGGANDYFDLSPRVHHVRHTRKCSEDGSLRGSLLESESAFIDPNGEAFPVSPEPELRPRQLSARERRRMKRVEAHSERGSERGERQLADPQPNQVKGHQGDRGEETEDPSCGDWRKAEGHPQVSQPAPHREISTETSRTETWTRPGTSDTLKRLGADPAHSDRPSSRESLVHGWDGPSTYHG
ncbi:centrosome and spindle pole-associated protein 1-like isoform X4 [Anguilla anguilla]|uniref:centrosome and spindle pole-associated protein 1-like isoform X4 n=1 Tax=Anguilla anguilla TaxID=7936 RepID=UPI0015AF3336|nr:centrosome and spindle pole-associated protein 1-like isoform X4 [Anguilla anguilla]